MGSQTCQWPVFDLYAQSFQNWSVFDVYAQQVDSGSKPYGLAGSRFGISIPEKVFQLGFFDGYAQDMRLLRWCEKGRKGVV